MGEPLADARLCFRALLEKVFWSILGPIGRFLHRTAPRKGGLLRHAFNTQAHQA